MAKAVAYDMDGMILHGKRFSTRYAEEFGISEEDMSPFFEEAFQKAVVGKIDIKEELSNGWLQKWNWKGSADELLKYWFESGNTIDTQMLQSIDELRAKGIPCVLTTNQEKYRGAYITETLGLKKHFDKVFNSAHIGAKKPDPKYLDAVFFYLKGKDPSIEKSEVLFWDDKESFVEGARVYGFDARIYTDFDSYKKIVDAVV